MTIQNTIPTAKILLFPTLERSTLKHFAARGQCSDLLRECVEVVAILEKLKFALVNFNRQIDRSRLLAERTCMQNAAVLAALDSGDLAEMEKARFNLLASNKRR